MMPLPIHARSPRASRVAAWLFVAKQNEKEMKRLREENEMLREEIKKLKESKND